MNSMKKRILSILLAGILLVSMTSCNNDTGDTGDKESDNPQVSDPSESEDDKDPAEDSEGTSDSESADDTTDDPADDSNEGSDDSEDNSAEDTDEPDDNTDTLESDSESDVESKPEDTTDALYDSDRIYNYLNGKTITEEEQNHRPVAVMINNIWTSLPQVGISEGEIYYECAAEGGITRIMMLLDDYEKAGVLGSIRSSRDYFVDFLANHDAIYVHAGGSPLAYAKISYRGINNIDGVKYIPNNEMYRDPDRLATMSLEHTLMTTGAGIVSMINYHGYRTELDPNQVPLFKFYDESINNKIGGSPATHVHMVSTPVQTVDFVYDEATGEYLRYQYNGQAHVDGGNGEQISVKNVLILFTDISVIPGDESGRLEVDTVSGGCGYYITNGQRKLVNWSRATKTSTMDIEYSDGSDLILNSGKTFICVVDTSVAETIDYEYEWNW